MVNMYPYYGNNCTYPVITATTNIAIGGRITKAAIVEKKTVSFLVDTSFK